MQNNNVAEACTYLHKGSKIKWEYINNFWCVNNKEISANNNSDDKEPEGLRSQLFVWLILHSVRTMHTYVEGFDS